MPSAHPFRDLRGVPETVFVSSQSNPSEAGSDITTSVALETPTEKDHPLLSPGAARTRQPGGEDRKTHRRSKSDPFTQKIRFDEGDLSFLDYSPLECGVGTDRPGQARPSAAGGKGPRYAEMGMRHFRRGEYTAAGEAYSKALKCYEYAPAGSDEGEIERSLAIASTLGNIGAAHFKTGNIDAAVAYLEEEVSLRERVSTALRDRTDGGPDAARANLNLGRALTLRGDYAEAMAALARSLRSFVALHGPFHVDVARTSDAMGKVHLLRGDFGRALECHGKALRINSAILHPRHPTLLCSMMSVADAHRRRGELGEAESMYHEVLDVQKTAMYKAIDPNYRQTVSAQVGRTLRIIGQVRREREYRRATITPRGGEETDVAKEKLAPFSSSTDDWGI